MAQIFINVEGAINDLKKAHSRLSKKAIDRAVVRALNHTISKAKTATAQQIRKVYGARSSDVKKALKIHRANSRDHAATLIARGRPLPLRAFSPRQTKKGVSIKIKGKRHIIHKAFRATMASGHEGVFARGDYSKGKFLFRYKRVRSRGHDLPITKLSTTSVPRAMMQRVILDHLNTKIQQDLPTRLAHELSRAR